MHRIIVTITLFIMMILGCHAFAAADSVRSESKRPVDTAIFAMGCFWCGESEFRNPKTQQPLPGITSIRVGYAGGVLANPTYQNHEGYKEAVKITFDPSKISYKELLSIFWKNIDPFDAKGQFCDKGFPYTSAIFYTNDDQRAEALASKETVQKKFPNQNVVTEMLKDTTFYDAEEYHQDYKSKNPIRYKYYRWNCGRDKRLKEIRQ